MSYIILDSQDNLVLKFSFFRKVPHVVTCHGRSIGLDS